MEFIALAAHSLDEHSQVKHTTTVNYPSVFAFGFFYAQSQVLIEFLHKAVVDVTRGNIFAILAEERRIVDGESHRHGRLVDGDAG